MAAGQGLPAATRGGTVRRDHRQRGARHRLWLLPQQVFRFRDWVGGRYSVWSAIGMPVMIAAGPRQFRALLDGARAMDAHFRSAPLARNLPVALALCGVWNRNFLGAPTQLIAPYAAPLARLPAYLQQQDMELCGKRVNTGGNVVDYGTGPIVWGGLGLDGQHAYFQLLHQGTHLVPADLIGTRRCEGRCHRRAGSVPVSLL